MRRRFETKLRIDGWCDTVLSLRLTTNGHMLGVMVRLDELLRQPSSQAMTSSLNSPNYKPTWVLGELGGVISTRLNREVLSPRNPGLMHGDVDKRHCTWSIPSLPTPLGVLIASQQREHGAFLEKKEETGEFGEQNTKTRTGMNGCLAGPSAKNKRTYKYICIKTREEELAMAASK